MKRFDRSTYAMSQRVLSIAHAFLARDPSDPVRVEGTGWYPRAWEFARRVQVQTRGASAAWVDAPRIEVVVGVIAALSPQVGWDSQLKFVPEFVRTRGESAHPGFAKNLDKARAIMANPSGDPLEVLGGLKVRAFYRAILGDEFSIVVDRHAVAAALGKPVESVPDPLYRECIVAYSAASVSVGMSPRDLQAAVWCEWRATKGVVE